MQADDQSSQSPPHSLSFDQDTPQCNSNLYNSFNTQTLPNLQNKSKTLSNNYCVPTKSSIKTTQSRIKNQTLSVDDKSLRSLPCSYQYSAVLNNNLPSTSDNYSNSAVVEPVDIRKERRVDDFVYNNTAKSVNVDENQHYSVDSAKRKANKKDTFLTMTEDNHDKNYSKYEKKSEKYPGEIDVLNEYKEVSDRMKSEKKIKNNTVDTSALKHRSNLKYINNTGNVVSQLSDRDFEKAKNAYITSSEKFSKEYSNIHSDTARKYRKTSKADAEMRYCDIPHDTKNAELLDSLFFNTKLDFPKTSKMSEYVDMGKPYRVNVVNDYESSKILKEIDGFASVGRRNNKIVRRHTTEYRGPSHFILPRMIHDSSDSVEKSPIIKKDSKNYPYVMLTESKFPAKKSSLTSTTSEDNSDGVAMTFKKEWRENKIPRKVDSFTVDRKTFRKNSSKSAKIKRRGSLNLIDPTMTTTTMTSNINFNKDNLKTDAKKIPLQISAEDMVQIANCGARNKNGSLCHFISTTNDDYTSISQALLNQSYSSEDVLTDKRSLNKKSSHSLVLDLNSDAANVNRIKRNNSSPKCIDVENLTAYAATEKPVKAQPRQHSYDVDNLYANSSQKEEYASVKKLVHTKSEGQRSYKLSSNYYADHNASSIKHQEKRSNAFENAECRCLIGSHPLSSKVVDKHDLNNEVNFSNITYRHFGTPSREELANLDNIEDTFDF